MWSLMLQMFCDVPSALSLFDLPHDCFGISAFVILVGPLAWLCLTHHLSTSSTDVADEPGQPRCVMKL